MRNVWIGVSMLAIAALAFTGCKKASETPENKAQRGDVQQYTLQLKSQNPTARLEACKELGSMKGFADESADELGGVVKNDGDAKVRLAAASALCEIRTKSAMKNLKTSLDDLNRKHAAGASDVQAVFDKAVGELKKEAAGGSKDAQDILKSIDQTWEGAPAKEGKSVKVNVGGENGVNVETNK